jgi:hypothetical protein
MAGTWKWFGNGMLKAVTGGIDLDTDTFKVMLTTSTYTPNQDTHDFRDDVTNEVTGTGYTAGGATLAGVSTTYDAASNQVRISWTDPTWPASSITARTAVIYKSRGGAATADELVAFCTNDADVTSTGATFTLDLPAPTLTITSAA